MESAYFSHPSLAYHTKTEEYCIAMIKRELAVSTIINPFDYRGRKKKDLAQRLRSADCVVGMSVYESYPFIVWNDLSYAATLGKPVYTITFPSERKDPIALVEGMIETHKELDEHETQKLYHGIMKQSSKGLVSRLFLGKLGGDGSVF
jgi:hypothetical protein